MTIIVNGANAVISFVTRSQSLGTWRQPDGTTERTNSSRCQVTLRLERSVKDSAGLYVIKILPHDQVNEGREVQSATFVGGLCTTNNK